MAAIQVNWRPVFLANIKIWGKVQKKLIPLQNRQLKKIFLPTIYLLALEKLTDFKPDVIKSNARFRCWFPQKFDCWTQGLESIQNHDLYAMYTYIHSTQHMQNMQNMFKCLCWSKNICIYIIHCVSRMFSFFSSSL